MANAAPPFTDQDADRGGTSGRFDRPMSDADVTFIQTRPPFCDLDPDAFSRSMPLGRIIADHTRLRRVMPGQILVRRGDYGNAAMLVLAGELSLLNPLARGGGPIPDVDGRRDETAQKFRPLRQRLRDCFAPSRPPGFRPPTPSASSTPNHSVGSVDQQIAVFVQDHDAILNRADRTPLEPGQIFGEVAATYRTPHAGTVVAATEAAVLEIDWRGLRELRRDKAFNDRLDDHYRTRWLPTHLRSHALLRYLDAETIDHIANASVLQSYGRLRWDTDYRKTSQRSVAEQVASEPVVVREGSYPTDWLLVRSGFGRVSVDYGHSVRTLSYLGSGHDFGLEAIVGNVVGDGPPIVHPHSLRAVGMLDVIAIPAEVVAETILPNVRRSDLPPGVSRWLPSRDRRSTVRDVAAIWSKIRGRDRRSQSVTSAIESVADPATSAEDAAATALREVVVGARLNNGTAAMVIDLDRCTGCDDCVRGCEVTHGGDAVFARRGIRHGRLQFAAACMQCVDPVCMIGCPTGAITRDAGRPGTLVTIDEASCIGCQTCAAACPYGNIDMVAVVDQNGDARTDDETDKPILKATKCDLCSSVPSGPACVSSCPHDALVRIDLSDPRPLASLVEGLR